MKRNFRLMLYAGTVMALVGYCSAQNNTMGQGRRPSRRLERKVSPVPTAVNTRYLITLQEKRAHVGPGVRNEHHTCQNSNVRIFRSTRVLIQHIKAFALDVPYGTPRKVLRTLSRIPGVKHVGKRDRLMQTEETQHAPPWGLDRIDQQTPVLNQQYTYTSTGNEVNVYVVDTGIHVSHNDFGNRAQIAFDAVDDDDNKFTDPIAIAENSAMVLIVTDTVHTWLASSVGRNME